MWAGLWEECDPLDDITLGGDMGLLVFTLISMLIIWRLSSATSDK
jgi:hypothetical protein